MTRPRFRSVATMLSQVSLTTQGIAPAAPVRNRNKNQAGKYGKAGNIRIAKATTASPSTIDRTAPNRCISRGSNGPASSTASGNMAALSPINVASTP